MVDAALLDDADSIDTVPEDDAKPSVRRRQPKGALHLVFRTIVVIYLTGLVLVPVGMVTYKTFEHGAGKVWDALTDGDVTHAFKITVIVAVIAVIADTVFGIGISILLVRHEFPGKRILSALIDLPLSVSPVVVGLALILAYGQDGWFGGFLGDVGFKVIFALPGMVLATIFVSMPLVVREVVPVLEEIGTEQEQAATTLGASAMATFRRITLPSIRWAVAYGVALSVARSLGEFGAVKVVSGNVAGSTQTATLLVEQRYQDFDQGSAYYAASFVLVALAVVCLLVITLVRPKEQ